jgi:protein-S-isoprenylcysteine O-methyltransferase Ste14
MVNGVPRRREVWRNVLFVIVVPGVVAVLGPWLVTDYVVHPWGAWAWLVVPIAVTLIGVGAAVLLNGVWRFAADGRGTPAPVAPTESLVVTGPYRYVRNPMYLGVGAAILGQALLSPSWAIAAYAVAYGVAVFAFVRFYEEPTLLRVHGEQYRRYREDVPGWWPRSP